MENREVEVTEEDLLFFASIFEQYPSFKEGIQKNINFLRDFGFFDSKGSLNQARLLFRLLSRIKDEPGYECFYDEASLVYQALLLDLEREES